MFYDNLKAVCDRKGIKITPLVAECGGAKGSISNWRKGAAPNSDIVLKLAVRLNVSTDYLLTGYNSSVQLSEEQNKILSVFNSLSPIDKGRVVERAETLAELAAERAAAQAKKAKANDQSSVDPRPVHQKMLPFPVVPEQYGKDNCYIDICSFPASAGTGVYLEDSSTEPLQIVHTDIADRANYAIRVSGDSMIPEYSDGDIVLVETCRSVEVGEIGIFIVDGEGYIKKYGGDRLISLNPKYKDMLLKRYEAVYCRGRVLGIADVVE